MLGALFVAMMPDNHIQTLLFPKIKKKSQWFKNEWIKNQWFMNQGKFLTMMFKLRLKVDQASLSTITPSSYKFMFLK